MKQRTNSLASQGSSVFNSRTLLIGAGALVLYGLSRRSKPGLALATAGGVIAFKAAQSQPQKMQNTRATFLVNAPPDRAYQLWRNFENLPRFMAHLKSVHKLDDRLSEWVAVGPLNQEIRWNAEITDEQPGHRIAWRSLTPSSITTTGSVEFRADPVGRGTFVTAEVEYSTPGGAVGRGLAALFGKHPEFMVREDLRRFKALLETGETPTTVGQPHGPRGIHGHAERVLFRETSNHPQPQAA